MIKTLSERQSPYLNYQIALTTKHRKADAVRPAFAELLAAEIIASEVDTDQLGTFSGEIERDGTAFDCACRKSE